MLKKAPVPLTGVVSGHVSRLWRSICVYDIFSFAFWSRSHGLTSGSWAKSDGKLHRLWGKASELRPKAACKALKRTDLLFQPFWTGTSPFWDVGRVQLFGAETLLVRPGPGLRALGSGRRLFVLLFARSKGDVGSSQVAIKKRCHHRCNKNYLNKNMDT